MQGERLKMGAQRRQTREIKPTFAHHIMNDTSSKSPMSLRKERRPGPVCR